MQRDEFECSAVRQAAASGPLVVRRLRNAARRPRSRVARPRFAQRRAAAICGRGRGSDHRHRPRASPGALRSPGGVLYLLLRSKVRPYAFPHALPSRAVSYRGTKDARQRAKVSTRVARTSYLFIVWPGSPNSQSSLRISGQILAPPGVVDQRDSTIQRYSRNHYRGNELRNILSVSRRRCGRQGEYSEQVTRVFYSAEYACQQCSRCYYFTAGLLKGRLVDPGPRGGSARNYRFIAISHS